jgi:transposase
MNPKLASGGSHLVKIREDVTEQLDVVLAVFTVYYQATLKYFD